MDLVPIKVKIGLRPNGHADHPNWTKLPLAVSGDPASHMFHGWKYDKTSGHAESSVDSPIGMQWGMLFVTKQFAKEAKQTFPALITELTESEAESFWNDKVTAHIPENRVDFNLLVALDAELSLREKLEGQGAAVIALKSKIAKALDPNDIEPGIKKESLKVFSDAKVRLDLKVVASIEAI